MTLPLFLPFASIEANHDSNKKSVKLTLKECIDFVLANQTLSVLLKEL